MVTVLTAPICSASGDISSSSGITACLHGKVTLTPSKPAALHGGDQVLEPPPRQAVEVHQVVVALDAGRRKGILVQRR